MGGKHFDLLIRNACAFVPQPLPGAFVGIRNGKIDYVGTEQPEQGAVEEVDAGELYLLPGLVDAHVHFRTPGLTHKEDYQHGSRAAAAGGVTTVLDMPNTDPATFSRQLLQEKEELVSGSSLVDYGFHFMLTKDNLEEIQSLSAAEVASVKVFMAGHETAPHVVYDLPYLTAVARTLSEKGIRMTVHAEYQPMLVRSGGTAPEDYSRDRKREAAAEAVRLLIGIAEETGCRIHVVHVSTKEETELLTAAKQKGVPVTFEVIHPHLSFTEEDLHEQGWNYKLSPPLRKSDDVARLWEHVIRGEVDSIGSDHAPHTRQEKSSPVPPAGMPGVQETCSAVFTGLMARLNDPQKAAHVIAELIAKRPAELFDLHGKGRIAAGYDADLVLFDPHAKRLVQADDLFAKCGWSPYEGRQAAGLVRMTWLRGQVIFSDGYFAEVSRGRQVYDLKELIK